MPIQIQPSNTWQPVGNIQRISFHLPWSIKKFIAKKDRSVQQVVSKVKRCSVRNVFTSHLKSCQPTERSIGRPAAWNILQRYEVFGATLPDGLLKRSFVASSFPLGIQCLLSKPLRTIKIPRGFTQLSGLHWLHLAPLLPFALLLPAFADQVTKHLKDARPGNTSVMSRDDHHRAEFVLQIGVDTPVIEN